MSDEDSVLNRELCGELACIMISRCSEGDYGRFCFLANFVVCVSAISIITISPMYVSFAGPARKLTFRFLARAFEFWIFDEVVARPQAEWILLTVALLLLP